MCHKQIVRFDRGVWSIMQHISVIYSYQNCNLITRIYLILHPITSTCTLSTGSSSGEWWSVTWTSASTSSSISSFAIFLIIILFLWLCHFYILIINCSWVSLTTRWIGLTASLIGFTWGSICTTWLLLCWCLHRCLHCLFLIFNSVLE